VDVAGSDGGEKAIDGVGGGGGGRCNPENQSLQMCNAYHDGTAIPCEKLSPSATGSRIGRWAVMESAMWSPHARCFPIRGTSLLSGTQRHRSQVRSSGILDLWRRRRRPCFLKWYANIIVGSRIFAAIVN
jgi:hypothetical protein